MAALKKLNKLKRLLPKVWIRYLIGYSLTNLYRIWIPLYNKVIIIRDVHFNKEEVFDGSTETLKYDIKNIFLKHLAKVVKNITYRVIIIILLTTYNNTVKDLKWSYKSKGNKKIWPLKNLVPAWRNKYIITVFELLPTPPDTPLKYLFIIALIMVIPRNTLSKSLLNMWEYKFKSV